MKGFKLFFIFFILSFYAFGAGIMDSFAIYHGWLFVGEAEFAAMHVAMSGRIIAFFVLPLLIATICNVLLFWYRPPLLSKKLLWIAFALQMVVWLSSAFIQIPIQFQLDKGKDMALLNKLLTTDWIRIVAYVANIVVIATMGWQLWKACCKPAKVVV